MPMFVGSQRFISLPSFMFVGAAVSGIRELNRNKKEKEKNLQNGFPGHISHCKGPAQEGMGFYGWVLWTRVGRQCSSQAQEQLLAVAARGWPVLPAKT